MPIPDYISYWRNYLTIRGMLGMASGAAIGGLLFDATILGGVIGLAAGMAYANYRAFHAPCDLTDWQIALLGKVVTPLRHDQIEPDSYDLKLDNEFHQIQKDGSPKTVHAEEIVIGPGECWLAHTQEIFAFPPNLKGILQGKSSWARLSLFVECAGLFDKGFKGTAVLELYNAGSCGVLLKRGDRIAQMSFHRTHKSCAPYGSPHRQNHYQSQAGARPSWLGKSGRIVPLPRGAKTLDGEDKQAQTA